MNTRNWLALIAFGFATVVVDRLVFIQGVSAEETRLANPVGMYQVVAPDGNFAWRLNTSTGELQKCWHGNQGLTCIKAQFDRH